ncbi:MAG: DUF1540 domain-containing protein [Defluviitaleaceae bacterium]|nr:DUF1540 domain-containing protein [Defluviitaleaceae bacterium]
MNQDIKCSVNSCKFYEGNHCNLGGITVGSDSLTGDARTNRETNCCSFTKK